VVGTPVIGGSRQQLRRGEWRAESGARRPGCTNVRVQMRKYHFHDFVLTKSAMQDYYHIVRLLSS
jgi:hypothetical protein